MSNYLVTGAAGFIGSAVADRLCKSGHNVWTIDNLSTGFKENLPESVALIKGDCQDQSTIDALKDVDFAAILHLAGQSSGEISFDDPVYDLRTNTESTLRLIQYGLKSGCKRFIYASSMSVYGAVCDEAISEAHPADPLSFYGIGKLASEKYLKIYATKGLQPTSLRFFNVYGPGQNMENLRQGMVSIFLKQLMSREGIIVKGALDRFRDFVFIDDCVDAIVSAIDNDSAHSKIYNIGTGVRTTVAQLLKKMMACAGDEKKIIVQGSTPGDQKGIYADIALANRELGFTPKFDLETGLKKMVGWARQP